MNFQLVKTDLKTKARVGLLTTSHGEVTTPCFMPVGTQATVKTLSPDDLKNCGTQGILCNTYHLMLRPGVEIIAKAGGLHKFMNWDRLILTDSGGFQVFSLAELKKVSREGVEFKSHIDGSRHFLSPQESIRIQGLLASDIAVCLDECLAYPATYDSACNSVALTLEWAEISKEAHRPFELQQALFGIVQGSVYKDLRRQCVEALVEMGFDGYAVGGLSVGEPDLLLYEVLEETTELLPQERSRYLMGCGTPENLLECVERGVDLFDCVLPTRNGRNGTVFTSKGKFSLTQSSLKDDFSPIDDSCRCDVCRKYTRAYLRHLLHSGEILGMRLTSYHNVAYYHGLMAGAREAIEKGTFKIFKERVLENYKKEV